MYPYSLKTVKILSNKNKDYLKSTFFTRTLPRKDAIVINAAVMYRDLVPSGYATSVMK